MLLARTCGDKAFTETAAAMAEGTTTAGSPLHTLALLMSGKSDAVHAGHAEPAGASESEQSSSPFAQAVQSMSAALLSRWRGNLAVMGANRVAGDETAIVKLGDRLWKERSQVYLTLPHSKQLHCCGHDCSCHCCSIATASAAAAVTAAACSLYWQAALLKSYAVACVNSVTSSHSGYLQSSARTLDESGKIV